MIFLHEKSQTCESFNSSEWYMLLCLKAKEYEHMCVFFYLIYSGRQPTPFGLCGRIYRGHTRGKPTQDSSYFILLKKCTFHYYSPLREGCSSPLHSSTVKSSSMYLRQSRSPPVGMVRAICRIVTALGFEPTIQLSHLGDRSLGWTYYKCRVI